VSLGWLSSAEIKIEGSLHSSQLYEPSFVGEKWYLLRKNSVRGAGFAEKLWFEFCFFSQIFAHVPHVLICKAELQLGLLKPLAESEFCGTFSTKRT
jgi:hypothetical protein